MSTLTETQISILNEAGRLKTENESKGLLMFKNLSYLRIIDDIRFRVSKARDNGASFEQLLCLIYGIGE